MVSCCYAPSSTILFHHDVGHLPSLGGYSDNGGDSNVARDQMLDKSGHNRFQLLHPHKQSGKIAKLMHSHGLVDIWRELNPHSKVYTHFSTPHKTYARIDPIFIAASVIPSVTRLSMRDSPLPDHSTGQMLITNTQGHDGMFCWRLNESILSNPVHCTILEKDIVEYFQVNDDGTVSPETQWASHMAVMRGKIIQLASKLKCERRADINKLEQEFHKISKDHR